MDKNILGVLGKVLIIFIISFCFSSESKSQQIQMKIIKNPIYTKKNDPIAVHLYFNRPYLVSLKHFPEIVECIDSSSYQSKLFTGLYASLSKDNQLTNPNYCPAYNAGYLTPYINRKSKKKEYNKKLGRKWHKQRDAMIYIRSDTIIELYINYPSNIEKGEYEIQFIYNLFPKKNLPNNIPNRYYEGYFESNKVKLILE